MQLMAKGRNCTEGCESFLTDDISAPFPNVAFAAGDVDGLGDEMCICRVYLCPTYPKLMQHHATWQSYNE